MYKLNGVSDKLLDIITVFLDFKKQRIVLNGQYSSWSSVEAGVPQGSIFGSLLFLIYLNGLSGDLTTNAQLFGDESSLFPIVHNMNTSTINLSGNPKQNKKLGKPVENELNIDPIKQAHGVTFSRKLQKKNHYQVYLNHKSLNKFPLKNILKCILILN